MSSNLSLLPYKYNVTYNSSALTIPAFPGAYIYNRGIDSSPTALPVPIYFSEPAIAATITFMADRDYMLLVLPGFKVSSSGYFPLLTSRSEAVISLKSPQ